MYPSSLRKLVILAINDGYSCHKAAIRYNIAPSTAIHWYNHYLKTGEMAKKYQSRVYHRRLAPYEEDIKKWISEEASISLQEIANRLPISVSLQTISSYISSLGYSYKKNSKGYRKS